MKIELSRAETRIVRVFWEYGLINDRPSQQQIADALGWAYGSSVRPYVKRLLSLGILRRVGNSHRALELAPDFDKRISNNWLETTERPQSEWLSA